MYQLTGEFESKIDTKGRINILVNMMRQLSAFSTCTDNLGFEDHLILNPKDVWEKKTKELNQLNIYKKRDRQALRYFYNGATRVLIDSSDIILEPKSLISYAGINKQKILFAYQEQIEIWAKVAYEEMLGEEPKEFLDLAEEIFNRRADDTENE